VTTWGTFYELIKFDGFVKSRKTPPFVIPAKAGIQKKQALLDPGACPGPRSGIRRGDDFGDFSRDRQSSMFNDQ
jgi:hypothetical protein